MQLKNLQKISVIGLGLLGASVTLACKRMHTGKKIFGYCHRESTKNKATEFCVADIVTSNLRECCENADLIILATPISIFEQTFTDIKDFIKPGCIITDVGSTKSVTHKWARSVLGNKVCYVGSHPIAGSEQRGLEYARDDLLSGANCIVTNGIKAFEPQAKLVEEFWTELGCITKRMTPIQHDRIFANVSHVPHVLASALMNSCKEADLDFAGKGLIDTSRIASGPANVWADILLTNADNVSKGIKSVVKELTKLQNAIENSDETKVAKLLDSARNKRASMIDRKIRSKEII